MAIRGKKTAFSSNTKVKKIFGRENENWNPEKASNNTVNTEECVSYHEWLKILKEEIKSEELIPNDEMEVNSMADFSKNEKLNPFIKRLSEYENNRESPDWSIVEESKYDPAVISAYSQVAVKSAIIKAAEEEGLETEDVVEKLCRDESYQATGEDGSPVIIGKTHSGELKIIGYGVSIPLEDGNYEHCVAGLDGTIR